MIFSKYLLGRIFICALLIYVPLSFSITSKEFFDEGLNFFLHQDFTKAEEKFKSALEEAKKDQNAEGMFNALVGLGSIYQQKYEEDQQKCVEYYKKALGFKDNITDKSSLAMLYNNIAYAVWDDHSKALKYLENALTIYKELGDKASTATQCRNISSFYEDVYEPILALDYSEQALMLSKEVRDTLDIIKYSLYYGWVNYNLLVDYQKVIDYLERSLEMLKTFRHKYYEARIRGYLGNFYRSAGFYKYGKLQFELADSLLKHISLDSLTYWDKQLFVPSGLQKETKKILQYSEARMYYPYTPVWLGDDKRPSLDEVVQYENNQLRRMKEGYLGVRLEQTPNGVRVTEIYSPAKEAGVETGDVIVGFNDHEINSLEEFDIIKQKFSSGNKIKLKILRDGKYLSLNLKLASYPKSRIAQGYRWIAGAYAIQVLWNYFHQRDFETSEENNGHIVYPNEVFAYLQKGLEITEEKEDSCIFCWELGNCHYDMTNYKEAYVYYEKSLALLPFCSEDKYYWYYADDIYSQAALALYKIGDCNGAEKILDRALDIFTEDDYLLSIRKRTQALILCLKGRILAEKNRFENAKIFLENAVGKVEELTSAGIFMYSEVGNYLTHGNKTELGLDTTITRYDVYDDLIKVLIKLYFRDRMLEVRDAELVGRWSVQALSVVEKRKAREFSDMIFRAKVKIEKDVGKTLLERELTLMAKIIHLDSLLRNEVTKEYPNWEKIENLEKERKTIREGMIALEEEMITKYPEYSELKKPKPMTLAYIQNKILKQNEIILEYFVSNNNSYVWVIKKNQCELVELEISSKILGKMIEEICNSIIGVKDIKKKSQELYKVLFKPFEKYLNQSEIVYVIPDGCLHKLPFELLYDNQKKEYMLQRYSIAYVQSISVLGTIRDMEQKKKKDFDGELIAFGDPVYSETELEVAVSRGLLENKNTDLFREVFEDEGIEFKRLPFSNLEVRNITDVFKPMGKAVTAKLRLDANEKNVKQGLKGYRYVHFATHAHLGNASSYAKQPALVMSLIGNKEEDGFLHMSEVFNLNLDADLIVLSACESGLGKEVKGEGIIGLTRAFMYAGTPSIVVSLWKVADRSTALLMTYFYKNLKDGMNKAEALRWAKIKLIEKDGYTHPLFWAPFILVGQWM
jgi:CHAT domain-containing protein/tetratricopeptide (TPR) repeat protein